VSDVAVSRSNAFCPSYCRAYDESLASVFGLDVLARSSGSQRFASGAYWEEPKNRNRQESPECIKTSSRIELQTCRAILDVMKKHIALTKRPQRDIHYQDTHVYLNIADESINDAKITVHILHQL
jgi:hypothetical protein